MAKVKANRVKIHRSYTFAQLARVVGVTVGTVRRWCKQGLPYLADSRPFLIEGRAFRAFHAAHLVQRRTKLAPFDVYCLGCKAPRIPEPGLVETEPLDGTREQILAICPDCGGLTRRIIGRSDLPAWAEKYDFVSSMRKDA